MIVTQHHIDHWRAWRSEVPGYYAKGETRDAAIATLVKQEEKRKAEQRQYEHAVFQESS